ncbi:MAG: bestrophin family ion channel [Microcoleaceae cyanobacterium MO_207.B10]|nr:bestrophin family ion channel [Microcoleaceae cyanobacterium MO_207.B10]
MNFYTKRWIQLVITLKGSVIPRVWQRVVISMVFSLIVTAIYESGLTRIHQPILASLIPGVVLGLLLVFRTNTSYDKYWEGRKLIGGIIISGRSLSRQMWIHIPENTPADTAEKKAAILLLAGLLMGTKLHLRNEKVDLKLQSIISKNQYLELKEVNHIPLRIAKWIGDYFRKLYHLKPKNFLLYQYGNCYITNDYTKKN